MKTFLGIVGSVVLLSGIVSCTRTVYVPVEQHRSELVVWHDTMVEVVHPGEVTCSKTIDTISVLHTQGASSRAVVTDGVLSHTLTEHPRHDSVIVRWREVYITDSIPYPVPVVENPSCRLTSLRYVLLWIVSVLLMLWIIGRCFKGCFTR